MIPFTPVTAQNAQQDEQFSQLGPEVGTQQAQPQDPNNENLPEELQTELYELVQKYENEDSGVRKQQLKSWKKNESFWHGVQYIFWSESGQDWISPADTRWYAQEGGREDAEGPFY